MIGALSALILVLFLAIAYILYCVRPAEGTFMGNVRHFALYALPSRVGVVGDRLLGPRFGKTLTTVRNYLFFTNNPLVMYFYIVVTGGCYFLYIKKILVEHSTLVSPLHSFCGNSMACLTFYFFYKAVRTPATTVTKANNAALVEKYRAFYDGTVFIPGNECPTCKVTK